MVAHGTIGAIAKVHRALVLRLDAVATASVLRVYKKARLELISRINEAERRGLTGESASAMMFLRQVSEGIEEMGRRLKEVSRTAVTHSAMEGGSASLAAAEFEAMKMGFGILVNPEIIARINGASSRYIGSALANSESSLLTYTKAGVAAVEDAITVSIVSGDNYFNTAQKVKKVVEEKVLGQGFPEWKAMRIVRTELMRAYNDVSMETMASLAASGQVEVHKKWIAVLDNRTGDDSKVLNGQVKRLDEPFELPGGDGVMAPPERPNSRCVVVPWLHKGDEPYYDHPVTEAEISGWYNATGAAQAR